MRGLETLPSPLLKGTGKMSDPPTIKEAVLSKRRRSEAVQLAVVNNTVNIDSYQKQRRPINLIPKSRNKETYIDLI